MPQHECDKTQVIQGFLMMAAATDFASLATKIHLVGNFSGGGARKNQAGGEG